MARELRSQEGSLGNFETWPLMEASSIRQLNTALIVDNHRACLSRDDRPESSRSKVRPPFPNPQGYILVHNNPEFLISDLLHTSILPSLPREHCLVSANTSRDCDTQHITQIISVIDRSLFDPIWQPDSLPRAAP
jgi:hypothetical protein